MPRPTDNRESPVDAQALARAWQVREAGFPPEIVFFAPAMVRYATPLFSNRGLPEFPAVSITGSGCGLNCRHCEGKILETMIAAPTPDRLLAVGRRVLRRGGSGLLVSGGADRSGRVPLQPFLPVMARLRQEGLRIVVHTGLVDEQLAGGLAEAGVDAVMLDVVSEQHVVDHVFGLGIAAEEYIRSVERLCSAGLRVAPHVVLGLDEKRPGSERTVLEALRPLPLAALVIVLFTPLPGTAWAHRPPPPTRLAAELLIDARLLFPTTPLLLGCARPRDRRWSELDRLAVLAGVNGLAYPHEDAITLARERGLEPLFSELCCSLLGKELLQHLAPASNRPSASRTGIGEPPS
jgi:hypothetical protein